MKYAKLHVFGAFEGDFLLKIENSTPHRNTAPPQTFEIPISAAKSVSISVKTFFFLFGDHLVLGGKSVGISDFGRKISLNFGEGLFFFLFFWRPPAFGQKKGLNFRAFREIPS